MLEIFIVVIFATIMRKKSFSESTGGVPSKEELVFDVVRRRSGARRRTVSRRASLRGAACGTQSGGVPVCAINVALVCYHLEV